MIAIGQAGWALSEPWRQYLSPLEARSLQARIAQCPRAVSLALEHLSDPILSAIATRKDSPSQLISQLISISLASDFLPRILAARPQLIRWLAGSRTLQVVKSRAQFSAELLAKMKQVPFEDSPRGMRALRRYKYRELLRLCVRETCGISKPEELGRQLSSLAECCVTASVRFAEDALIKRFGAPSSDTRGFAVLALGKLGGEDLNFSSDIDLLYVYRAEGETTGGFAGSCPNVQFYRKLAENLTRLLSAATADGFCYRVDLNLRPYGRSGPIVLSLSQTLSYYEAFGRTWERAALIKLRHVCGDAALSGELVEALTPFVWRRAVDQSVVESLRQIRMQIALQGKVNPRDLKLGAGGIREIEFFVNGLQLLHGGKQPRLRERNTLRALRQLEQAGLLSGPDADRMEAAYGFLRHVENRLQMVEERQTHTLPTEDADEERLVRSLGFESRTDFRRELSAHREFVARSYEHDLGLAVRGETPAHPLLAVTLDAQTPDEKRLIALKECGFVSGPAALTEIERLQRICESAGASSAEKASRTLDLLGEIAASADPDQALLHLGEFLSRLASPQAYVDLLHRRPLLRRQLINLFAQTELLARYFVGHPELIDLLLQLGTEDIRKGPARIREELSSRLSRHTDPEEGFSSLRRFKNEETLRIALSDISNDLSVPEVAAELTAIADGILDECLNSVEYEMRERYGEPRGPNGVETLAVIGMGKLGGTELGYHSDLDLIFVYSGEGSQDTTGGSRGSLAHHEYFAKAAQRLLALLHMRLREGYLYQVDTRLRPSGNKGTLVVSAQTLRDYHERHAQLWERQALTKARGCAGDLNLFLEIESEIIHPLVYFRPLPEEAPRQIDRLRRRMEREISGEGKGDFNPKTGHGGMVDVEFLAQYLQMLHGPKSASVRVTPTLSVLEALRDVGALTGVAYQVLKDGYLFLRKVENRLRLLAGYSKSQLPDDALSRQKLARLMGYLGNGAATAFMQDYRQWTDEIRALYSQLMSTSGVEATV